MPPEIILDQPFPGVELENLLDGHIARGCKSPGRRVVANLFDVQVTCLEACLNRRIPQIFHGNVIFDVAFNRREMQGTIAVLPGGTPGFNGDVQKALRSIKAPFLYMPSETDLYFPISDALYESQFMPTVTFRPIPSLWGHTAGAASNPVDAKFLNDNIAKFLGL